MNLTDCTLLFKPNQPFGIPEIYDLKKTKVYACSEDTRIILETRELKRVYA